MIYIRAKYEEWLTDDGLLILKGWARDGLSNKDIAHNLGVSESTFREWRTNHSAISAAIKTGREPIAVKIEDAFYSRCDWREVEEIKEEIFRDSNGRETRKKTITKRTIPPDTAVLIFALKNLRPDKWQDKPRDETEAAALSKAKEILGGVASVID